MSAARRSQSPAKPALRPVLRSSDAGAVMDSLVAYEPVAEAATCPPEHRALLNAIGPDALSEAERARLLVVLGRVRSGATPGALEQMALAGGVATGANEALDARLTAAIATMAQPGQAVEAVKLAQACASRLVDALEWAMRYRYPVSLSDDSIFIANARGTAATDSRSVAGG